MRTRLCFCAFFKITSFILSFISILFLLSCSNKKAEKPNCYRYDLIDEICDIDIELNNGSLYFSNSAITYVEITSTKEIPYTFRNKKLEIKTNSKDLIKVHVLCDFKKKINSIKYKGNIANLSIDKMSVGNLDYIADYSNLEIVSSTIKNANILAKISISEGSNFGSNNIDCLTFRGDYVHSLEIYNNIFRELNVNVLTGKMVFGYTKFNIFNCSFKRGTLHLFLFNNIGYQINANVPGLMQFDFENDATKNGATYNIGQPECTINISNNKYFTYIYKLND